MYPAEWPQRCSVCGEEKNSPKEMGGHKSRHTREHRPPGQKPRETIRRQR